MTQHEPETPSLRDMLAVKYRPYVLKIAREIAESVGFHVEIDDLVGWGHMGLIEAADRFDPARGVTFRTFAHRRIRGAMLDGMRKEFGLACAIAIVDEQTSGVARGVEVACVDAAYAQDDHVLWRERRECIESALETLTPLELAIVRHHYYHGQPVQLLVGSTRYSKSWLSRVHRRALSKMRDCLLARASGREAYL
jgi:RNA polymerase sigma factor (sigma-70 family)